ncbi:MAG: YlbF family regulator [Roseburia sp.]|nr:YlbF family regulator [Anaeroplasma bactoclasticum]MCM1196426.1 YlbF family regulator [Roseburia sp.]MCM1557050.1 YlbF family regulator [Anaeroplasma bactoclasticum]
MKDIYDLIDDYAIDIINSPDFQRLLECKEEIKKNLSGKIMAFKTAEAKYLEAKEYGKYHPNLEEYKNRFIETKTTLFNDSLVKEYKELESKIQEKLTQDINDLKKSVSNKFKLNYF